MQIMKTTLVLIEVMEACILELEICGRSMGIVNISDLVCIYANQQKFAQRI